LLNGLASSVARAVIWARSTLACSTIIPIETVTLSSSAVAQTLVRALHVVMGRVYLGCCSSLSGRPRRLDGAVWVYGRASNNSVGGSSGSGNGEIVIQISLGGVNVGTVEGAGPLRAISSLPVAVARAHIEAAA